MLLRHLGACGPRSRFCAAVTIAAPVDLLQVSASLEATVRKRMLNFAMVTGLKLRLLRKHQNSGGHNPAADAATHEFLQKIDVRRAWRATKISQFDEAVVCRL